MDVNNAFSNGESQDQVLIDWVKLFMGWNKMEVNMLSSYLQSIGFEVWKVYHSQYVKKTWKWYSGYCCLSEDDKDKSLEISSR